METEPKEIKSANGAKKAPVRRPLEPYSSPAAPASVGKTPSVGRSVEPATAAREFTGLRVSLMPTDREAGAAPDAARRLYVLALVLIVETLLIGAAYFFLLQTIEKRTAVLRYLTGRLETTASAIKAQETGAANVGEFAARLAAAKTGLDDHVRWSAFFAWLEKHARPDVKFVNFSGDFGNGTITIDAAAKTYRDVAEQIVVFRDDPLVSQVRAPTASARIDEKGNVLDIAFSMLVKLKPTAWMNESQSGSP